MGNRIAPDGGKRISFVLLAFVLVASLVQVVAYAPPAQALANENGPAPIPGASTATISGSQWETKNQHRIWRNGSRWDAILPTTSGWQIAQNAVPATFGQAPTYGPIVGANQNDDRPDVFWDSGSSTLYVLMSGESQTVFYRYSYAGGVYTLAAGPINLAGMGSSESRATILKTTGNELFAAVMNENELMVSRSSDNGATWSTSPLNLINAVGEGQTQLTTFTDGVGYLGIAAAEDGDADLDGGRYSEYLFYKIPLSDTANFANVTRATGTLTFAAQPVTGDTVRIGEHFYTFQDAPIADVPNRVAIGATVANTRNNLVAAINGTGTPGAGTYSTTTLPHESVTIGPFNASNNAVVTAKDSADSGAGIATTASTAGNSWVNPTLTGGSTPWTREKINITIGNGAGVVVHSDDELSLVTHNNIVYIASETQRDGVAQAASDPQVVLYRRNAGGTWEQSTVKRDQPSSTLDRKRPVVAVLDNNIYIMAVDNPRTNSFYWSMPIASIPWGNGAGWGEPKPLFNTLGEAHRNNIVPRGPLTTASDGGLPVLIDWAWDAAGDDQTVWQTLLPNSGNQAPGAHAGPDTTVSASPATNLGALVSNDTLGGAVNWSWSVVSGPGAPGGVVFTPATGQCAAAQTCQLPTTAAFVGGLGTYVLRLTATEVTAPNPLSNTDEVTVTVNSLVNAPPVLTVTNPKNGDKYTPGAPVVFDASAIDALSGDLTSAITWSSSPDGIIGLGGFFVKTNLSVGTHVITATVTDGQNQVSSTPRTITVAAGPTPPPPPPPNLGKPAEDEMLFYRADGTFKYYDATPAAGLKGPILQGTNYSKGWEEIVSVDMDGDGQDEILFYRTGGSYAYYNINPNGTIGAPIRAGTDYSKGWTTITAVDLDGDGQDEIFFYRPDGTYRYYNIQPNGSLGSLIRGGNNYSKGWTSISAVDLDGDGQDEIFFYREDGTFRYYNIQANAGLGSIIASGSNYSKGWNSISAVDLDGDGQDEMFFYRTDGNYRYYNIQPNTALVIIRVGADFSKNWTIITAVNLNGHLK